MMLFVPVPDTEWLVSFAKQLNRISLLTFLFPAVVGIWHWHLISRPFKALVWYALIPGCLLGTLTEVGRLVWHNNLIFTYLVIWLETVFLGYLFYQNTHVESSRRLLKAGFVVFVVVAATEWLYFEGITGNQAYTRATQSILLIGATMLYFEQILQELRNIQLHRDPMFLVSIGVILYYAGALMVFILEDSMHRQHQANQIWMMYIIQFILLIVLNMLFALALWYASRPKPETQAPPIY
jgi:hypothetical protein